MIVLACSSIAIAQKRVVLVEQFTNSGCPPCAANTPIVFDYVNKNLSDVVAIAYHTSFPYKDSMYFENPVETNARVAYYSNISSVPHSVIDGNYFSKSSSQLVGNIPATINPRKAVGSRYTIQNSKLSLIGNLLDGDFQFTSINADNANEKLVAYLVVIEKNVLKNAYKASPGANEETEYGFVMRKMIPDANGTSLANTFLNGTDGVSLRWTLKNIKNINEVKIIAFVQNATTKEVYQAQMFSPSLPPTAIGYATEDNEEKVRLYPNPSNGTINIALPNERYIDIIAIINPLGEVVHTQAINAQTKSINAELDLENGIYYLQIGKGSTHKMLKINFVK